ncbi:hypothetical protein cypCar_00049046, partial [Cyprinus carpio]
MKKGSLIGNIAHDLGLDVQRLRSGQARIVSGDSTEYVELKTDKGILVVKERIDREHLCAETTPCSFTFEIILDNPVELHHVTVEILDVNDHSPTFPKDEINLEISESATPGSRFLLGSADDSDVGSEERRKMASSVMWHQAVFLMVLFRYSVRGQISYSIPEEMPKGSIVGNISQGLGLDLKKLKSGKARIFAGDNTEFVGLNNERGVLLTKQKIDREALCAKTTPCALHLQLILENPMEWYDVTVEIIDINDNAPSFPK